MVDDDLIASGNVHDYRGLRVLLPILPLAIQRIAGTTDPTDTIAAYRHTDRNLHPRAVFVRTTMGPPCGSAW